MMVPDLCKALAADKTAAVSILTGTPDLPVLDPVPEAADAAFLSDSAEAVKTFLADSAREPGKLVVALESNAVLASFQRAYELARKSRVAQWAAAYTQVNRQVQPASGTFSGGALVGLLPGIATKPDDEYLLTLLPSSV